MATKHFAQVILLRTLVAGGLLLCGLTLLGCDRRESSVTPEPDVTGAPPVAFRSEALESELDRVTRLMRTRGYEPVTSWGASSQDDGVVTTSAQSWRGFLAHNADEVQATRLKMGACEMFLVVGSSALRALDVRIYDSEGERVAEAGGAQQVALPYCPEHSGTYFVALGVADGAGLFSVRQFRGPTGIEVGPGELFGAAAPEAP